MPQYSFPSGKSCARTIGNAVDRHLPLRENQSALHYISTEVDEARSFTYGELYEEVNRFSAVLKSLGLRRGDRGTSPTAIRVLKRQDPAYLHKYNTGTLQRLYLAGEPLDEPTWEWIGSALKIPILDNYWQTETGWPVLALLPGVEKPQIRPGSPGIALFGYDAKIVDPGSGETLPRGEKGILAFAILAAAEGRETGDLSTLEDPAALDAIKELIEVTKRGPQSSS